MDCYCHSDCLRWEILYWVIQLKGQNCPLKIRSFGLYSFLLSPLSICFHFFFFFSVSFMFFVPSFLLSLLLSHTHTFSLSLLIGEAWMRAADGCYVSHLRGIVLVSFPPSLSLPGGQQGGLKSNWQLAGRELTQGLFRAALIDNCK